MKTLSDMTVVLSSMTTLGTACACYRNTLVTSRLTPQPDTEEFRERIISSGISDYGETVINDSRYNCSGSFFGFFHRGDFTREFPMGDVPV